MKPNPPPSVAHSATFRHLVFIWMLALAGFAQAQTTFTTGDVFAGVGSNAIVRVPLPSEGGTATTPFATLPFYTAGQIAWSLDRSKGYATIFGADAVYEVSSTGTLTFFAMVSGPTGIVVMADGKVLCSSYGTSSIIDITAGGAGPFPTYVTGISGPRNLCLTSTGKLLVCA